MNIELDRSISESVSKALRTLYNAEIDLSDIPVQETRRDFQGDRTVVVFPFLNHSKKNPEETGRELGEVMQAESDIITNFNVIKGFLNLEISTSYWLEWLLSHPGKVIRAYEKKGKLEMVEYSSPNTNKPLHLGHIRNNLLGYSVSEILKAAGSEVLKVQVINDRGIHICKSMLAWQKFGNGEDPEKSGKKGDHLVGDYYVKFDSEYKREVEQLTGEGMDRESAEKSAPILLEAQEMLRKWEQKDKNVVGLWTKMNNWVYSGFEQTYRDLGVNFDKLYYESETYLIGKEEVIKGLDNGTFIKDEDGSVWVDLRDHNLDRKLLIRTDGTSVYMTQDLGTAVMRFRDYPNLRRLIYTVGNEQNYHFKVLFLILEKLGYAWASECRHLSYGMVELPGGRMKSREGTVVDADDLIAEMIDTARIKADELGKLEGMKDDEKFSLYRIIGLGALKYYILKVDPKKQIVFNPEESIDFNGNTGPFIQYTYARIKTLLQKSGLDKHHFTNDVDISVTERNLIKQLYLFREILIQAAAELNPALIANYIYELVKQYNQFYQSVPVLKEENSGLKHFRLYLSSKVAETIRRAMALLGIEVPDRM